MLQTAQGGFSEQKKSVHTHIEKLNVLAQSLIDPDLGSNVVQIMGDIDGLSEWQWNLNAQTEHFNLNHFIENWPSDLRASLNIQGSFDPRKKNDTQGGLNLTINNLDAQGELRGLAVSAHGEINFDGEHWSSSDANVAIGANQLVLKGQIPKNNALKDKVLKGDAATELAIDWKINAPMLGQIDPGIKGSIMSSGVISGDKANPRIQIKAQVNKFVWHDYAIDNLSLTLNPKVNAQDYDLLLDAAHLQWQAQTITHLGIKGAGTLEQHLISGQVDSPDIGSGKFTLSSGWKDEIWRGKFQELALDIKKIPRWSLSSALPMEVNTQADKKAANLGKLCLSTTPTPNQQEPSLCLAGQWNEKTGAQVDANLTAVPANQLQAWFKAEAVISGTVDGQLKLQIPTAKPLVMDAHLATKNVQLVYQFQGGKVETYPLQKGSIDASIKNDQLNANLVMDWARYGTVSADTKYAFKDK
ncbi:MAG: hypothetical protein EOO68_20235, partial [Moraxellaceae bacterium]